MHLQSCLLAVAVGMSGLAAQTIPMFEPGAAMNLGAPPGTDDRSPTLNTGETVLLFSSNRIGSFFDIFLSVRSGLGAPFAPPVAEPMLNSPFDDLDPQLFETATGQFEIWFTSTRPGPGPSTIWVAQGRPGAWSLPALAPGAPGPNVPGWSNRAPSLTDDGLTMFFSSDAGGAALGGADIYLVRRAAIGAPWGPPIPFAVANSPAVDEAPMPEANGNIVWFSSTRLGGGGGGRDVWVTSLDQTTGQWTTPMAVTEFNTPFDETGLWRRGVSGRMFLGRVQPTGARLFCDCWRLTNLFIRNCPVRHVRPQVNILPAFWPRLFWHRRWDWRIGSTIGFEWYDWWQFPGSALVITLFAFQIGPPLPSGLPEEGTLSLPPATLVTHGFALVTPDGQASSQATIPANPALVGLPVAVQGVLYAPGSTGMPDLIWTEPGEAVVTF